jgi:serine/threonine protein kinase
MCLRSGILPTACSLDGGHYIPPIPVSRSAFSDVYRGRGYGKELAVKVLRVHADERNRVRRVSALLPISLRSRLTSAQAYLNEVIVWVCIRHPNVVPFVGVPRMDEVSHDVILVSEWMSEGTVSSYFKRRPREHRGRFVCYLVSNLRRYSSDCAVSRCGTLLTAWHSSTR